MEKKFEIPELIIIEFADEDIILTSTYDALGIIGDEGDI